MTPEDIAKRAADELLRSQKRVLLMLLDDPEALNRRALEEDVLEDVCAELVDLGLAQLVGDIWRLTLSGKRVAGVLSAARAEVRAEVDQVIKARAALVPPREEG